jgi:hypothetical protein
MPLNPLDVNTPSPLVWETLDSETQTLARGDTDRPAHERPPRLPRPSRQLRGAQPSAAAPAERKRLWIYVAAGIGILVLFVGTYLAFFNRGHKPTGTSGATGTSHRIVVSQAGGENTVATLRDALSRAGPGDTIVIADARVREPKLTLLPARHKDLTIESATPDGRAAVIETTGGSSVMFDLSEVEGVKLRNLEFDGKNQVDTGLQLSGRAPGTVIEGVTVRGVKSAAFKLSNAAGEPARPILVAGCRALLTGAAQIGVSIYSANAVTHHTNIQGIRVEGNGTGIGIRLEGACADVEITGGRFFKLEAALWFERPSPERTIKARVASNTVFGADVGLMFNLPILPPPPAGEKEPPPGKLELVVERNYFAGTKAVANKGPGERSGELTGVKAIENAHGPECGQGSFAVDVWTLNSPTLAGLDPAHDATFLRFVDGPPAIPKNVRVGAP